VLGHKSTAEFDSYILSESSLIVYPFKVILKTCGRTVPLESLQKILQLGRSAGTKPEWCCYSRKNFLRPDSQVLYHRSYEKEAKRCQQRCGCGSGYVAGPITGDHWFIYNADFVEVDGKLRYDWTLDIMMYELPQEVRLNFYESHAENGAAMTEASGLGALASSLGGEVDDISFSPCGYSCNVHFGSSYFTVHVTPEDSYSYASFETNIAGCLPSPGSGEPKQSHDVKALLRKVLDIFKPGKFTMSLMADDGVMELGGEAPFEAARGLYRQRNHTTYSFEMDYSATVANFVDRMEPLSKRSRTAGSK
jgi:S-adenosylmethionine decarboxylase